MTDFFLENKEKKKKYFFRNVLFYSEIKFWWRLDDVSYLHKELFNVICKSLEVFRARLDGTLSNLV